MKILVTGANGMLAKEVKERFSEGNEIIATDVAYPATSPTVFAFKFKTSANFLNVVTNIYFEINTISPEYTMNFIISTNIPFSPLMVAFWKIFWLCSYLYVFEN